MHWIIIILYGSALSFILAYSLVQLYLTFSYRRAKKSASAPLRSKEAGTHAGSLNKNEPAFEEGFPMVSIQLPIYNEKYVVERLMEAVSAINYPKGKLEIQILDDSTDETSQLLLKKIAQLKKEGLTIEYLHRSDRSGFKAGALAEALPKAKGEFIAIFDADFIPGSDFLQRIMPHFKDQKVGMVQSRWAHLNRNFSLLTKLQAFGLDAHFSVEQGGRYSGGHFMNFNGTAGVWRKETIVDAGGWESDTLTEDLDLSYRAQLEGWTFVFDETVESPAELPAEMNALKNQQYRWNKGAAECMRKNLSKVLRSRSIDQGTKLNAIFHLMNSAVFLCVMLLALLSIPLMFVKFNHVELNLLFRWALIFLIPLPILAYFYYTSEQRSGKLNPITFLLRFTSFLSVSMGLSLHNAIAVTEGYLGRKTPFVRTPKFNLANDSKFMISSNVYLKRAISPLVIVELLLAAYFLFGMLLAFHLNDFGMFPFHLMLFVGFSYISIVSILHAVKYYS